MKKILVVLTLCFAAIASFAAIPTGFNWNTTDPAIINNYVKFNEENNKGIELEVWKCILKTMNALATKDANSISYTDFKKLIYDNFATIKERQKQYVPQFVNCISRFNTFAKDVFNDEELLKDNFAKNYIYSYNARLIFKDIPIDKFREITIDIIARNGTRDINLVKTWVTLYKIRSIEIENSEMLKDLKNIKKVIYSNINISDEWKSVVVNVELMIKSIQ